MLQTRWLVRAPIWLFRARLGFLFGGRVLLLEHHGRKSGLNRYVALETVARPTADTVVIASGFGRRSQWFRNLAADPRCRVSVGLRYRVPATARELTADESARVMSGYRHEHPRAYRELRGVIEDAVAGDIDTVPLIELTLTR
ncbi:deazaflavin-dependent oxidoreductase (nitroreductase family) [Nocardia mexicana]|uniref:Deazaflavin-dependent oxidoreductase (Nitroreductase family) n=2 Tax=Nocardia mexicana TaxID=279262 RepID=A0A370GEM8_9NOCA|nr:deazaflavin-dependent oxidoreductase (nitroreductase family) [Nocardia mexicana]